MTKLFRRALAAGLLGLFFLTAPWPSVAITPATITDDAGQILKFDQVPARVVSLAPSATEIIAALKAEKKLAGITYQDSYFEGLIGLPVVGSVYTPNFDFINAQNPDLLIVSPQIFEVARAGRGKLAYPILVWDEQTDLRAADLKIAWLGEIFQDPAASLIVRQANQGLMETLKLKTSQLSPAEKLRVMRVVGGHDAIYTPGQDSFQTELIAAVGGIAPQFGPGPGNLPVSVEKWRAFNPQMIYGCSQDKQEVDKILADPAWSGVEAVKNKRVSYFPCALTDRAAAHTGYFAAWLASTIYGQQYGQVANLVHPQEILKEKPVDLNLPFVARARVVESRLLDFVHNTLLIDFKTPQSVISTADGPREGILTIGNSSSPPMVWGIHHQGGWEQARVDRFRVHGLDEATTSLIFTGANMDNLAVKTAAYEDLTVTALVTAGVEGNAIRTSKDSGAYYKPGTINIIVLSSRKLSPKGAARALITITEAKTAALWDMDIRSAQTPKINPATGTGTDDIIVAVAGEGEAVDYTGGHAKIGELIARAVYQGVQEALRKQNGKAPRRHIFERLAERGLNPHGLLGGPDRPGHDKYPNFQADLEALLLTPRYQGFIEAALSLDDARVMGQMVDAEAFELWARSMAGIIAGGQVDKIENIVTGDEAPPLLKTALNALGTGLKRRVVNKI
ncbi:MAG: adenosylcobinamide amidohydrolase [Candidatus Adiutrix sp.]|jgi:adenosylcobinamide amidohydrolase/ABC-type Fe3+-hydroxamate transport system substrate-binding protein|nr:adenosylcobinamide amidohydrolase [Candidatus Adiutrix sp.]